MVRDSKILLLPGMDGSGELFREFVAALPEGLVADTVRYPADHVVGYAELEALVWAAMPTGEPFVLVAESYSTPLAIQIAATLPEGLRGLVLCAGFATSPVKGLLQDLIAMLPLTTLRLAFPTFVVRRFLVGNDAPEALVRDVVSEIGWVEPEVLAARAREMLLCNVRAELARVQVPIRYLRPAEDRLVSLECLEEILRIQLGTAVTTIDGPHMLLQREPTLCAEMVAEFVSGLESRGSDAWDGVAAKA